MGPLVTRVWGSPASQRCDRFLHVSRTYPFIVEGTYELTVGDQTSTAGPGTIVFIPRHVVHRFKNVGDTTARMLNWSLPGGQDHDFTAISELAAGGGFTGEKVMEISQTFDMNFPAAH